REDVGGRLGAVRGDAPGGSGSGESKALAERQNVVEAFIALMVRALDLDRALLLMDDGSGRAMRCVGHHGAVPTDPVPVGAVPPGGPWSALFPVQSGGHIAGQLLLARGADRPLTADEYALGRQLADGAGSILENAGLAADL